MDKTKIVLLLIFGLALFLRFFNIAANPPSLNWDEVSHGYNAYSILKTGHDEWGEFLPIGNFRAYGDYPLPLYMYLTMPFIAIFGLNDLAIRLPSILLGSLLVIVIFFLTKIVSKNPKLALLASFLVAISPWWVMTNRQVIQSTPAVFFLTLGVTLFLSGMGKISWKLFMGAICIGLSAYAYHNTRIIAPFLAIVLLGLFWQELLKHAKTLVIIITIFLIFFAPLVPILALGGGSARATWVGILDQGAINQINECRGASHLPGVLRTVSCNKISYLAQVAVKNYVGYFGPIFLGLEGGTQYQFSVPHFGVIFPVELPFLYAGLIYLIIRFKKNTKLEKLLLLWMIVAPIPAAITRDPYQVVRATTMIPVVYVIEAIGFGVILKYLSARRFSTGIVYGCFFTILVLLFFRYNYNFYNTYPLKYSASWQYGYKQVVAYIQQNQDKYQTIAITKNYGEPHEFLLFYSSYDPFSYQHDANLVRYARSNWFWVDSFSKYRFINDWEVKEKLKDSKNVLLIASPGNYPKNGELLQTIDFLDGQPAFDIVKL